jgi:hypothetical protein
MFRISLPAAVYVLHDGAELSHSNRTPKKPIRSISFSLMDGDARFKTGLTRESPVLCASFLVEARALLFTQPRDVRRRVSRCRADIPHFDARQVSI